MSLKARALAASIFYVVMTSNGITQELPWDSLTVYRRLQQAVDVLKRDCKVDILSSDFPIEFACGGKFTTAGEAWSDALDKAGFPRDIGEREEIARQIGLDKTDIFNFVSGRANNISVERLLFNLKLISERR